MPSEGNLLTYTCHQNKIVTFLFSLVHIFMNITIHHATYMSVSYISFIRYNIIDFQRDDKSPT